MAHVERFSDRVADYTLYRPSYPAALIELLKSYGLSHGAAVMDAGSGTGILSELLLREGARVYAVEPNQPMREEAESRLGHDANFLSIAGSAEKTTLADHSVDLITAAQSFHWFDVPATRTEWHRILRPNGWVALLWNERVDKSDFSLGYREMAHAFVDKQEGVQRRLIEPNAQMRSFFGGEPNVYEFANHQDLNLDGLIGRALSSSYWPKSGPEYEQSLNKLRDLFERHNQQGIVRFDYITQVFVGNLV